MDVKRKLYKGYYKNYDFFANDVRRVFHNAFVFNREEKAGLVYQAALHLSNEFEIFSASSSIKSFLHTITTSAKNI